MRLYLHIPFCLRKCPYCDFVSYVGRPEMRSAYLEALRSEMRLRAEREGAGPLLSLYVGGGTPSVFGPGELARLVEEADRCWGMVPGAEVSVEVNPATWGREEWRELAESGFNRVSVGVQSFDRRDLAVLGRAHGGREARQAAVWAMEAEGLSVNLDLIYGVPGQSPGSWSRTLQEALSLSPHHLSLYLFTPEPATPLGREVVEGKLALPEEDEVAEMYGEACAALSERGYRHYEISNFAMPGHECRHNLAYWRREAYLGAGVAAHSFRPPGLRESNPRDLRVYMACLQRGALPQREQERLTGDEIAFEMTVLSLRTSEGMPLGACETAGSAGAFRAYLEGLLEGGLAWKEEGRLGLTERVMLVSNMVIAGLPSG